jgi:plasmid segregation protein ParM
MTVIFYSRQIMDAIVRAVDAGRGNIKFVVSDDGDDIQCMHFPSEAYPAEQDGAGDGLASKRKTVGIPIDGLFYEVGPDAHLAADVFNAKVLQHDAYYETTEYLALAIQIGCTGQENTRSRICTNDGELWSIGSATQR